MTVVRLEGVLKGGTEQDVGVEAEDVLSAIALVYIKINNSHTSEAMIINCMCCVDS